MYHKYIYIGDIWTYSVIKRLRELYSIFTLQSFYHIRLLKSIRMTKFASKYISTRGKESLTIDNDPRGLIRGRIDWS